MYTSYLEGRKQLLKNQLSEANVQLVGYIENTVITGKKKKYVKDGAIRYLVKYERFKNAPINQKLQLYIKENNINIDGSFYLDLYKTTVEKVSDGE